MQKRKFLGVARQTFGQRHDDRKDHCRGADDRGANQNRLGSRLESIAGAVILFEQVLGALKNHVVVLLEFFDDVWLMFNERELKY